MKKLLALILVIVLCFSVCACNSNTGNEDSNADQQNQQNDEANKDSEENEDYNQIIEWLKNDEYDAAIGMIQKMKEDAAKAENESKGIKEVAITLDNWSEYFEFAYDYDYYRNSFGEITHINCSRGFKLKDGYELVVDDSNCPTKVAFEAVQESYAAEVTYNFAEGTFTLVDVDDNDEDNYTDTNTTTYSDNVYKAFSDNSPATGVAGMGSMWQGSADDGEVQNESVTRIIEVLRAEGTIYIYEN